MKKKMSIVFLLLLASALLLSAAEAVTITDITGKVEIRPAGVDRWQRASTGEQIELDTTISTGFNATAVLDLGGSILEVRPLTRMTVTTLLREEDTVTTDVFLKVGKVKAEVETAKGVTHDFSLRTSTMTASVRGTEFIVDEFTVECRDGEVLVRFASGREIRISGGGSSGGESDFIDTFTVSPYTATDDEQVTVRREELEEGSVTGTLEITYQ
jgi:hypothetical protein